MGDSLRPHRSTEARHRVVIVGGGVAALEAMLALRRLTRDRAAITLVAPEREFIFRPLVVGEPFGLGRAHRFDLAALAASAGAEVVNSKVVAVEADDHRVLTEDGRAIGYDALIVAPGARMRLALAGALTVWGIADAAELGGLLVDLERGDAERVAFAIHPGAGWPLPLYELALLTAAHLRHTGIGGRRLSIVTHEEEPLEIFGRTAAGYVRRLLDRYQVELVAGHRPAAVRDGALVLASGESFPADRVVSLPRLEGPRLAGIPADDRGFIPVDELGRVRATPDVYAAGDATAFTIKQGGLAAQQAYAAATAIARRAGAAVDPEPFRPVLRGVLLTGGEPSFVLGDLGEPAAVNGARGQLNGESTAARLDTLWWPPGKVAGRFLAPHLDEIAGHSLAPPRPVNGSSFAVEVEVEA